MSYLIKEVKAVNLTRILKKYNDQKQITMVTAWDALSGHFIERSKVDCLLVGDSLGMTALGHTTTIPVTLSDMIHHTKAVTRVAKRPFVISDLPFSAMNNPIDAAIQLISNGAQSVKIEGVHEFIPKMIHIGIPVLGHLGLAPQHVNKLGGYKIWRDEEKLVEQAKKLESMKCWGIVLECVPAGIARKVQEAVNIPIVGIGAGVLDGQVLVFSDLLGLNDKVPKFCRVMANAGDVIDSGIDKFCDTVESKDFPNKDEVYS